MVSRLSNTAISQYMYNNYYIILLSVLHPPSIVTGALFCLLMSLLACCLCARRNKKTITSSSSQPPIPLVLPGVPPEDREAELAEESQGSWMSGSFASISLELSAGGSIYS